MICTTFKNCDFSKVYNYSNFTLKLNNIDSNIGEINLKNSTTLLDGNFNSPINVIDSCNLNLCQSFNLLNNIIRLINTRSEINNINIYGNLNTLINDLNIESDLNVYITISLSSLDSDKFINIYCTKSNQSDSSIFKINDIYPPITLTGEKIPINLIYSITGNLEINTDLSSCNFINGKNVVFYISPEKDIDKYLNITDTTFKSITGDETSLQKLIESVPYTLPIDAVVYKVKIIDGNGSFSIPKSIDASSNISASIILGDKEFKINN